LNKTPRSPASMVMNVAFEKMMTTIAMSKITPKVPRNLPEGNPKFGWLILFRFLIVNV
jgi:hypothetical protein